MWFQYFLSFYCFIPNYHHNGRGRGRLEEKSCGFKGRKNLHCTWVQKQPRELESLFCQTHTLATFSDLSLKPYISPDMSWSLRSSSSAVGFMLILLLFILLITFISFSKYSIRLKPQHFHPPEHKLPPLIPSGHYGWEPVYNNKNDTTILIESCRNAVEDDPGRYSPLNNE